MSSERSCIDSPITYRVQLRGTNGYSIAIFSQGPYKAILGLKAGNKPYTPQRFRAFGKVRAEIVNPPPLVGNLNWLSVSYLGKDGKEIELASQTNIFKPSTELAFDKYLDIYSEWRGLGVQVIRVSGNTTWIWLDIDVTVESLCYELTWVG